MDILHNILLLLKDRKLSQKELCNHLGISKQAFTNWKSGYSESYKKYLPQIAQFLGVSVDSILGNGQKEKPAGEGELSDEYKIMLAKLMKLSPERLEIADRMLDSLIVE